MLRRAVAAGLAIALLGPSLARAEAEADALLDRPIPVQEMEWRQWARTYAVAVPREARLREVPPHGSIAGARTAIAVAERLVEQRKGRDALAPFRPLKAFRVANLWIVAGTGKAERLAEAPIVVLTLDRGEAVQLRWPDPAATASPADAR